ncbi:hypothetical protein GC194_01905 [bacterium]|nr:hypothetical protein [bacterium]
MKHLIILALIFIAFGSKPINAQTAQEVQKVESSIRKNGKYSILVMNTQHLKAAIKTGIGFTSTSQRIDFQIVTCGKLLDEIAQDPELQNLIKTAVNEQGLKILACGLSIEQLNIDKTLLPVEMQITGNGLIYMFGLQEKGFNTIAL